MNGCPDGMNAVERAGFKWGAGGRYKHPGQTVIAASKVHVRKATTLAAKIEAERDFVRGAVCAEIAIRVVRERAEVTA